MNELLEESPPTREKEFVVFCWSMKESHSPVGIAKGPVPQSSPEMESSMARESISEQNVKVGCKARALWYELIASSNLFR